MAILIDLLLMIMDIIVEQIPSNTERLMLIKIHLWFLSKHLR